MISDLANKRTDRHDIVILHIRVFDLRHARNAEQIVVLATSIVTHASVLAKRAKVTISGMLCNNDCDMDEKIHILNQYVQESIWDTTITYTSNDNSVHR